MSKKSAKKSRSSKKSFYSRTSFQFLVITTVAALFLLGAKTYLLTVYQPSGVLGASTFIADNNTGSERPDMPAPIGTDSQQVQEGLPTNQVNMQSLNQVEFRAENNNQIRLHNGDLNIEVGSEAGQLNVRTKDQQGTELKLQGGDALEKINNILKENDMEIGSSSANELTLRKGNVEAQTHFPLSINPTTNALTVTTPAGVKTVTVLPDQAVENLMQQRIIDSVSTTTTATNGAQLQLVTLGLLNNQPAFQVQGVDNKKLLGFLPVSIDKTAYVSAQNGQVLQTNESFLSQILDLLSTQ